MTSNDDPASHTISAPQFASIAHRSLLLRRVSDGGYAKLSDEDLWHYHAYDYAWRRVVLSDRGDQSPADPKGAWFNTGLVERAEQMFRFLYPRPQRVESAVEREAAQEREAWARQNGCSDFTQAMAVGLKHVARGVRARGDDAQNAGVEGNRRARAVYLEDASPELKAMLGYDEVPQ